MFYYLYEKNITERSRVNIYKNDYLFSDSAGNNYPGTKGFSGYVRIFSQ